MQKVRIIQIVEVENEDGAYEYFKIGDKLAISGEDGPKGEEPPMAHRGRKK